jgi:hypothetical protein
MNLLQLVPNDSLLLLLALLPRPLLLPLLLA